MRLFASFVLVVATVGAALGGASGCDADPLTTQFVRLDVTPERVPFGTVPLGAAAERLVIIVNRGNAPWLPAAAPTMSGPFTWLSGCDEPVGPGAACEARVRFVPIDIAPIEGTITFFATGAGEEGKDVVVSSTLIGEGAPPTLLLSPDTIDFGELAVRAFAAETITIENVGDTRVDVDLVVVHDEGSVTAVSFNNQPRTSVSLEPGEQRALLVNFAPLAAGPVFASVIAEVCGPRCGPAVRITGEGSAPRIDAAPRRIDLGKVPVLGVKTGSVRVSNIGNGVLVVTAFEFSSNDVDLIAQLPDGPVSLAAGEGIDVVVRYAPRQGRASVAGVLSLSSTDPISPEVFVPVTAQAEGPGFDLAPQSVHFGRALAGERRTQTLVLRSTGTVATEGITVAVSGAGFTIEGAVPTSMAPGDARIITAIVDVNAAIDAAGGATGTITATSTNAGSKTTNLAVLAGTTGCVPVVPVSHVNLGFVPLRSGAQGSVVVENRGTGPCLLNSFAIGGSGLRADQGFSVNPLGLGELAPGASGRAQFGFTATTAGARSIIVEIGFDDVPAPVFVSANATGIDGSLGVLPPTVTLGPLVRGCGNVTATASLVNDGRSVLDVVRVDIDPPDSPLRATLNATLPFSLAPGASRAITVRPGDAVIGTHDAVFTFISAFDINAELRVNAIVVPTQEPVSERFTAAPITAVDILFVVDNSGSMQDDQEQLAQNFAAFFRDALSGGSDGGSDFQVGVTTTDVLSVGAARGALVGNPAVMTRGTPGLETAFANAVRVGVNGTGLELGLEAMRLALESPQNLSLGFLRQNAALSIIIVTDEEDTGAFPEFLPDPALARDPADYVAFLTSLKTGSASNTPVLVSGVLPRGAPRYQAIVNATGGLVLDIGDPVWGQRLSELGNDTFSLSRSYTLQNQATAGTIQVTVDGTATTNFVYDEARRTVTLAESPRPGAEIVVRYVSRC